MKENFYHGILIGIFGYEESWSVSSNQESGDGYSDIVIETDDGEMGIIMELKYALCIITWRLFCPKLPTCKTVYAKKVQIVKIFTKGRVVW